MPAAGEALPKGLALLGGKGEGEEKAPLAIASTRAKNKNTIRKQIMHGP
jgi:hypothetical protein